MGKGIKLVTLNAKGLGSVIKRRRIEVLIKRNKPDIVFLQETHQSKEGLNELKLLNMDIYEKSFGSSKARGVAILISKHCECVVNEVVKDIEGRYIILQVTMGVEDYTLVNVYAPNVKQKIFYYNVWEQVEKISKGHLILAGDFNMVIDKIMDKTKYNAEDRRDRATVLTKFIKSIGLKDVWREIRGDEKKYTFYSAVHKSYTRIDYVFVSQSLITNVINTDINMIKITDHALLSIEIDIKKNYREARRWRMNTNILHHPEIVEKIKKQWMETWNINERGGGKSEVIWDCLKAVVRGYLIKEDNIIKRSSEENRRKLENSIRELEKQYFADRDKEKLFQIETKKRELEKMEMQQAQRNLLYLKRDYFEYSNRNSKLLARITQEKKTKKLITTIRDATGKKYTQMKDKLKIVQEFYQNLYMAKGGKREDIEKYITQNLEDKIEQTDALILDGPIKSEEIEGVIDNLKNGKTPGVDGLGPEFYKIFKSVLIPKLKKLYNEIIEGGKTPDSWKQSLTILIPKPNKDLTDIGSYRPISLINQDAKIFTAILAKRMNSFIGKYIKEDQSGFIKGRQMVNLTRRVLNIVHKMGRSMDKACVLSLDIFKAFDCVQWPALKILLEKLGFGKKNLGVINQLYSDNTTTVMVNDGMTEQIFLGRGTRQGCPLSPVLFCIVIELLANAIRKDDLIKGMGENGRTKISLFADDALLTIKNPLENIPRIKAHLEQFGEITGLYVNWQKTEILLFNHNKQEREIIAKYGLKEKKYIRYLGIELCKNIQKTKSQNFNKMKEEIKNKMQEYTKLHLSWFGRIAVVKMKILPKINFLFRMLPIQLSQEELKGWQGLINRYCNGGKKARLNKILWYRSQKEGGIGMPNIENYYIANQFRCLGELVYKPEKLIWWELESAELKENINRYLFGSSKLKMEIENPFLRSLITIWNKHRKKLSPEGSPLNLVTEMENFPINMKKYLDLFKAKKVARLKEWINKMKSKEDIKITLQSGNLTWLNYYQLERWTKNWLKDNLQCREYTKFELFLLSYEEREEEDIGKGAVSKIYKIMTDLTNKAKEQDAIREVWQQDLNIEIKKEEWIKIWKIRILRSLSVRIKENYYKLVLRWYMTPARLNRMNAEYSKMCWKCDMKIGTYFHLWWECEKTQKFWCLIFEELKKIMQTDIECKPEIALLSMYIDDSYDVKNRELIANLMTAARLIIAKNWKLKQDFKIEDWYNEVWNIALNDKLSCSLKVLKGELKKDIFYDIWGRFIEYVLIKGKGKEPMDSSVQFWRGGL